MFHCIVPPLVLTHLNNNFKFSQYFLNGNVSELHQGSLQCTYLRKTCLNLPWYYSQSVSLVQRDSALVQQRIIIPHTKTYYPGVMYWSVPGRPAPASSSWGDLTHSWPSSGYCSMNCTSSNYMWVSNTINSSRVSVSFGMPTKLTY